MCARGCCGLLLAVAGFYSCECSSVARVSNHRDKEDELLRSDEAGWDDEMLGERNKMENATVVCLRGSDKKKSW